MVYLLLITPKYCFIISKIKKIQNLESLPIRRFQIFKIVLHFNCFIFLIEKPIKAKATPEDLKDRPGIQYPVDIWFHIGRYIKPEDVKIFAAICKGSYSVSRSYSFWMKMYKRWENKYSILLIIIDWSWKGSLFYGFYGIFLLQQYINVVT